MDHLDKHSQAIVAKRISIKMKLASENLPRIAQSMNQQIGNDKLPLEIERRKLGNRRVEKQKMKTGELFAAADKAEKAGGKPK